MSLCINYIFWETAVASIWFRFGKLNQLNSAPMTSASNALYVGQEGNDNMYNFFFFIFHIQENFAENNALLFP